MAKRYFIQIFLSFIIISQSVSQDEQRLSLAAPKWNGGCQVLIDSKNLSPQVHGRELAVCYLSLREKILNEAGWGKHFDRIKAVKAMNLLENPFERDFYAKLIAAHGEASILTEEEMIAVMLTLDNRVDYFKYVHERDDVNTTMVLTQPYQYSFFNENPHAILYLRRVLQASDREMSKAIRAYILYQNAKITWASRRDVGSITHYYSTDLDHGKEGPLPCWRFAFIVNPPRPRCAPPHDYELPPINFFINDTSLYTAPRPCPLPCSPPRHRFFSMAQKGARLGIPSGNLSWWKKARVHRAKAL
ncbi:MAG: hypothetical protein OXB88_08600 [Bacteriovoracales bacterium]|nr:hypothetical protein [Bacteriovoracales bacterium]